MRFVIGLLIVVLGIALALYLGLWVMLIGGIVQIINSIKETPVNAIGIAVGILRFMCTSVVAWLSFFICFTVGAGIVKSRK